MEYNHERYLLNKYCEFRNREAEADFMEHEKASNLKISRFMALFMGFVFAMFVFSDFHFFGDDSGFFISPMLRGIALLIAILTFIIADKFKRYEHTLLMISLVELLVFAIYLVKLYVYRETEPSMQFMTILLFLLTVFLIPNKWKNSLICGCIILASYIIFCSIFSFAGEIPSITQRGIYLLICLISCAIFIYGRESSERKHFAAEQLLKFMSITDRLTGIYNRGRFEHVIGTWIKNMRHDPFCLVLFDIDDFKKVNDRFGHNAGDEVLIGLAEIVSASIRDDDIFARWGGEEFVVLFSGVDVDKGAELAERIRKAVEGNTEGKAGRITISLGVVQYHREESIENIINRADEKMYEAKNAGKNQVAAENLS